MRPSAALLLGLLVLADCKSQSSKPSAQDKPVSRPPIEQDAMPEKPADAGPVTLAPAAPVEPAPRGLPPTPSPDHNPTTPAKIALGELLFFDPALSAEGVLACASCHSPTKGWASGTAIDDTADGTLNQRHTPSLWNLAYQQEFYWDGRAAPLEAQILGHWQGQLGADPAAAIAKLASNRVYAAHFERAFGSAASRDRAAEALGAFVRTLRQGNSPWDRYEAGDATAVSREVAAGWIVFNERAGCANCHQPPLYTDLRYHNLGLADRAVAPDSGRYRVSKQESDRGAFKTPGLRGLAFTAPYFHNGSAKTLEDVLNAKEAHGVATLSAEERRLLLLFLAALSSADPARQAPALPRAPAGPSADGGL